MVNVQKPIERCIHIVIYDTNWIDFSGKSISGVSNLADYKIRHEVYEKLRGVFHFIVWYTIYSEVSDA